MTDTQKKEYSPEDFFTPIQLSKILQLQEKTIQKMCRNNKLPYLRLGRKYFIPQSILENIKNKNLLNI